MKAIRLCAAFAAALISLSPALRAQTYSQPPGQLLAIGDTNTVTAYAVSKIWEVTVTVWGADTNGQQVIAGWSDSRYVSFDSIQSVESFVESKMQSAFNQALTNNSPKLDLSQPCTMTAVCHNPPWQGTWAYIFSDGQSIYYPKNTAGVYTIPDVKKFPVRLAGDEVFFVNGIKWAICQTYFRTNGALVSLWDSRTNAAWIPAGNYDANGGVNTNYSWFVLRTKYACDSITYSNRIELVDTNGYHVIGANGFTVSETPVVLSNPVHTLSGYSVSFSGGDPGRILTLMDSSDLVHWNPVSTSTNDYSPQTAIRPSSVVPPADRMFYRVKLSY